MNKINKRTLMKIKSVTKGNGKGAAGGEHNIRQLHSVAVMLMKRETGVAGTWWLLFRVQKQEPPCGFGEDENFKISSTEQPEQLQCRF